MDVYAQLCTWREEIRKRTDFTPRLALVLGSGLGGFANSVRSEAVVEYGSLSGFPVSTVEGHQGRFIFGYIGKMPTVIMQGRVHYYEGYDMAQVVAPIRLMHLLGADILFLTNAAGGINPEFQVGDLMQVTGHISTFVPSPLRGKNIEQLGVRFPDMSVVYDAELRQQIASSAEKMGVSLQKGVYVQTPGPNYETPEEIRMFAALGADAVGMSTACEAIAARHMGMRVCAVSCISNMAAGISKNLLSHADIQAIADHTGPVFEKLLLQAISDLS